MEAGMSDELTVQMVAQMTGKTRQTVYNWIKANKLKTYGVHGATRIDLDSLTAFLNAKPVARDGEVTTSGTPSPEGATGL
jgi:excisionase family DNA binding protein